MKLNYQELLFLEVLLEEQNFFDKKSKMIIAGLLEKIRKEKAEETQIKVDEMHEQQAEDISLDNFRQDDTLNK